MSATTFLKGRVLVHHGDCLAVLPTLAENSVDSCVTDPPYGLQFMGREWDKLWRNGTPADQEYVERTNGELTSRARKLPDYSATKPAQMQEWHEAWAREVYRVLKPGAHVLAFCGTRTYHRMACAIEDAGFEIRDCVQWLYGSGFPKSHDVSKGIDKAAGAEREVVGVKQGHGASSNLSRAKQVECGYRPQGKNYGQYDGTLTAPITAPATPESAQWQGWGTALKPACELIVLARKPLSEKTVAANVLRWGTGALNIDGCRVEHDEECRPMAAQKWEGREDRIIRQAIRDKATTELKQNGRWPANVIHDGSDEVVGMFPESISTGGINTNGHSGEMRMGCTSGQGANAGGLGDSGSAARFFYTAKADSSDRIGSKHPTVKPLDLIQYLIRLVTPPGGTVLDLFAGTGTTGEAAFREGMRAVLIEREAEYFEDIRRRMALVLAGPDERSRESIKAKLKDKPIDAGPLFVSLGHAAASVVDKLAAKRGVG